MENIYIDELIQCADEVPFEEGSVLVTGASGLIGSFIIETLLTYNKCNNKEIQVYAMARNGKYLKERFGEWLNDPNLHFLINDITKSFPYEFDYDIIIHLASNADPKSYALFPAETITTNVIGTYNVLEYAKQSGHTKVFLASTMEVYGQIDNHSLIEERMYGAVDFNSIRQGYSEGKRTAELMCESYWEEYGVPCWIGRFGYIYGSHCRPNDSKVIFQFIRDSIEKKTIFLKSDGLQKRSYCYCADAASAIFSIIDKGMYGERYNIADCNSVVSIKELAEIIARESGVDIVRVEPNEQEKRGFSKTADAVLCSDKLKLLGWNARINIYEGISRTIKKMKEGYNAE